MVKKTEVKDVADSISLMKDEVLVLAALRVALKSKAPYINPFKPKPGKPKVQPLLSSDYKDGIIVKTKDISKQKKIVSAIFKEIFGVDMP